MLWTEVRRWAKDNGFSVIKDKTDEANRFLYYWSKDDNPKASGVSTSVSKLATDIYNTISNNQWLDYQKEYKEKQEYKHFTVNDYK
jgi:hypothetical protein